jgi:hypothetical protein
MARLAIRQLKYSGDSYYYESPIFEDGLNIIEGTNGSGKTTFSDLLYYGLSGDVEKFHPMKSNHHKEIRSDKNNCIDVHIQIGNDHYFVKRFIGSNDISVSDPNGNIDVLPIFRSQENKFTFSDWILGKLEIDPVELSMGTITWKINIRDIFRLIYHDQAPNPIDVFKSQDVSNFISDSKVMRRAIFEVLIGKAFHDYYKALSRYRENDNDRLKLKGAVDLYKSMAGEISKSNLKDMNTEFIKDAIQKKIAQLSRIEEYFKSLSIKPQRPAESMSKITIVKSEMLDLQLRESQLRQKAEELIDELSQLQKVKTLSILEVTQIKKMIYAHEQLGLFSADTCPYCLRDVKRNKNKCVCGADIDESEYEKFFYSSSEYMDILQAKQKTVETVDEAILACERDLNDFKKQMESVAKESAEKREKITAIINQLDGSVNFEEVKDASNKIVELKNEIGSLRQQLDLEQKRQDLEDRLNTSELACGSAKKEVDKLFADANFEMDRRITQFGEKYNEMMQKTVKDCRRASIDSDYMPLINDGEYREASAAVPRRLLYYFTLLYLSLLDDGIRFPRFLLIDTPETSGIDRENLIKSFECIKDIAINSKLYQIILLTGIGKYPDTFKDFVVQTVTDDNKLLQKK